MKIDWKFDIFLIIILIIISMFTFIVVKKYLYKIEYIDIVTENTNNNFIDPYLVLSIIKAESGFNKNSISKKNAYGLMQLLLPTAIEMGRKINLEYDIDSNTLLYPNINIKLGTEYMSNLIKYYKGNYYLALCAYNAGQGNVDKWITSKIISYDFNFNEIDKIPFNETKSYLKKVVKNYKMYKVLY